MKRVLITIFIIFLLVGTAMSWRRRRRRRRRSCRAVNCGVGSWTSWSSCSRQCGTSGEQTRTRQLVRAASCGGSCPYKLRETRACNRNRCQNSGTPHSSGCSCRSGYRGTCCEYGEFRLSSMPKLANSPSTTLNRKRKDHAVFYV